jgi:hypothetical protein
VSSCILLRFTDLIPFNAARIKTFQPELPDISGKIGVVRFSLTVELPANRSWFVYRAERKASFEISEKNAEQLKGEALVYSSAAR